ncbi:MAG TPA: hypothetical protein VJ824_12915 [Bacillota bacterium]|nr:hypothetical protein [Bacillota bacterium]
MAVYLITYDLKNASGHDYSALHDKIKSFGAWWHYLESTWLVDTTMSAQTMSDEIRKVYQPEYHLVIKLTGLDYQGWLPKEAWDWVKSRL